jgi:sugar phosphate isomerase/epimerase
MRFGIKRSVEIIMDAGFPAIDITMHSPATFFLEDDYRQTARELREMTDARGVVFNQAHAPFGGGYDNYTQNLVPTFPRAFEFASLCGIKNVIVHPLQRGRYYGHAEELFEMNMEFYTGLAPLAKENGIKIAIENMWQRNPQSKYIRDDVCADPVELARYYDTLNDPEAFTVCLDLGHVAICGREPEDAIRTLGSRIGALHVHDVDYVSDLHTLPGIGKVNWKEVCRALADVDYKGEITLEADYFMKNMDDELIPMAERMLEVSARHLAEQVEAFKAEK